MIQCLGLLFIKVLEALSREMKYGYPENWLYDDMTSVTGSLVDLKWKLEAQKEAMESKGFGVNVNKTK